MGEVQAAKEPASLLHWKCEPASEDVKPKLALRVWIVPEGPEVMVVLGAAVSTVKVRVAGSCRCCSPNPLP